jgi:hypothetical protein
MQFLYGSAAPDHLFNGLLNILRNTDYRIEFLQMHVGVWILLVNANCSCELFVYFACLSGIRDAVLDFSTSNSMTFLTSYVGLKNWRVEFL